MALQAFPLSPVNPKSLMEITPKNTHRYPVPITKAMTDPAYIPIITYKGGQKGDDVSQSSANSTDSYSPRTQAQKSQQLGVPMAVDITTPRGWVDPSEPYGPMPPAPTISGLAPATGVHGAAALVSTITGTGFTPGSAVISGGVLTPFYEYVSPTQMKVTIDLPNSSAGTIDIKVWDHGVLSASSPFVIT